MSLAFSREWMRIVLLGETGRRLVSVFAIALGVALGYGIHLIHSVAVSELEQAARLLSGGADLEVRADNGDLPEGAYPEMSRMPEVATASPVLELQARVANRRERIALLGIDVFRAAEIQPALAGRSSENRIDSLRPDRVFVNPAALAWLGLSTGDDVEFQSGVHTVRLRIAGALDVPGQPLAVMDIAGAQAAFGKLGRLSRVDLRLRGNVSTSEFADTLASRMGGLRIETPEVRASHAADFTRAYRINLNVLSLVALFTGGLLVFSSQALAVIRRRAQFGLLRALGVTRRQLVVLLTCEGGAIGLVGGALGIALGYFLARVALNLLGADLGGAYFTGLEPDVSIHPLAAGVFIALGAAAAALGSYAPAREASRTSPSRALHAGDDQAAFARLGSPWPGLASIGLACALALLPPAAGIPFGGYFSIAFLLVGCIALLPRLAAAFFALLPPLRQPMAQLALSQLRGAPGQASVSLAPLVASIAVAVAMAIMVGSFRQSLESWLDRMLPADLYLRAGFAGDTGFFSRTDQAALSALEGVEAVHFLRSVPLSLAPDRPPVILIARAIDARQPQETLPLVERVTVTHPGKPIWISEIAADLYGWRMGDEVRLPLNGSHPSLVVAGIWRDYARSQGAIVMEREIYQALTGDQRANEASLSLRPGIRVEDVEGRVRRMFPGGTVEIARPQELRSFSLRLFDRTFAATYALESAAVVVGLAGLSASFAALVLARRREFGVLRHLGVRRREVAAMLAAQGALLAGVALVVGSIVGGAISLILIHVVNRQSFHWSMDLSIPWLPLGSFSLAMLLLAAVTALLSGRQAMRKEAVLVVKEDW